MLEEFTFLLTGVGVVTVMLSILAIVFMVGWISGLTYEEKDNK
jgi:Na+-transporting methylmalonyl-CoA/oxaloacetate decarboxylase gamma subunit